MAIAHAPLLKIWIKINGWKSSQLGWATDYMKVWVDGWRWQPSSTGPPRWNLVGWMTPWNLTESSSSSSSSQEIEREARDIATCTHGWMTTQFHLHSSGRWWLDEPPLSGLVGHVGTIHDVSPCKRALLMRMDDTVAQGWQRAPLARVL